MKQLVLAVTLLLLVHGTGILLYTRGFLLSRFEVSNRSTCTALPSPFTPASPSSTSSYDSSAGCWSSAKFSRVVLIVIDALRFDFVIPERRPAPHKVQWRATRDIIDDAGGLDRVRHRRNISAEEVSEVVHDERWSAIVSDAIDRKRRNNEPYYTNSMPVLSQLVRTHPERCLLMRCVADTPTVTMQRLKAMVTGGMPTFIDLNDVNFESAELQEDNLLDQLSAASKRIVFMGDDTWRQLFPSIFRRYYAFPSFNAKDLHTVDNGVEQNLFPELAYAWWSTHDDEEKDMHGNGGEGQSSHHDAHNNGEDANDDGSWELLIAHFLGVDHVGHRFGPDHPAMTAKLMQMNDILKRVVEYVDDDTLLMVIGDHGMTEQGNHGGATDAERHAALFFYSNRTLNTAPEELQQQFVPHDGLGVDVTSDGVHHTPFREVQQIDVVPTLSLLLGVPIPFGNLGLVIPELFLGQPLMEDCQLYDDDIRASQAVGLSTGLHETTEALALNAAQILQYLRLYSSISTQFPASMIAELEALYDQAQADRKRALEGWGEQRDGSAARWCTAAHSYIRFQEEAAHMCRLHWATFDLGAMVWGMGIIAASALVLALHVTFFQDDLFFPVLHIAGGACVGLLGALAPVVGWGSPFSWLDFSAWLSLGAMLGWLSGQGLAIASRLRSWRARQAHHIPSPYRSGLPTAALALFVALQSYGMFSNSYIEAQDKMVVFFLVSSAMVYSVMILKRSIAKTSQMRFNSVYWKSFAMAICVKLSSFAIKGRHEQFSADDESLTSRIIGSIWIALPIAVLALSSSARAWFVTISYAKESALDIHAPSATLVYKVTLVLTYSCVVVYRVAQRLGMLSLLGVAVANMIPRVAYCCGIISALSVLVKPLVGEDDRITSSQRYCVATARVLAAIVPLVALVLGPNAGFTVLLHCMISFLFLMMHHKLCENAAMSIAKSDSTMISATGDTTAFPISGGSLPIAPVVVWAFLALHLFFASGHHWSFSSLHFEAAFIGFEEFHYACGAAIMALNTFAGPFLHALGLPLLYTFFSSKRTGVTSDPALFSKGLSKIYLLYISLFVLSFFLTSAFVYIERRHLMVWRVFAPKFVFDAAMLLVVDISCVLSLLVAWRFSGSCATQLRRKNSEEDFAHMHLKTR